MSKQHALHNEKLCDHLIATKGYNDWVVTSAFYASLHFVQGKIFPAEIGGKKFQTFVQYYTWYKAHNRAKKSKHKLTIDLVASQLPLIATKYRWLHDMCSTARYQDYQVLDPIARIAKKYLDEIKKAC